MMQIVKRAFGESIMGFYLVTIDTRGTIAASAMLPSDTATPERIKLVQTSLMTFRRAE